MTEEEQAEVIAEYELLFPEPATQPSPAEGRAQFDRLMRAERELRESHLKPEARHG